MEALIDRRWSAFQIYGTVCARLDCWACGLQQVGDVILGLDDTLRKCINRCYNSTLDALMNGAASGRPNEQVMDRLEDLWDCVNAVRPNLFPLGSPYRAKRTKHKAQAAASPSPH